MGIVTMIMGILSSLTVPLNSVIAGTFYGMIKLILPFVIIYMLITGILDMTGL